LTGFKQKDKFKSVQPRRQMDFSSLDNDQLLELIRGAMAEAVDRGMQKIAEQFYLEAQEEARAQVKLAAEAAQAAASAGAAKQKAVLQRNAEIWASKAAVLHALKAHPLFKEDEELFLNIWQAGNDGTGEVRVYLKGPETRPREHEWEIVFHYTGNNYSPPLSIEGLEDEFIPVLTEFFRVLCNTWTPNLSVKYSAVKTFKPNPEKLNKYRAALGLPALEAANV
jgi:hypothetical protein